MASGWTRRRVVKTGGALFGGLGLAGCSDSDATRTVARTGGTPTESGNPALRRELGLTAPEYDYADTLRVFQWENYWPSRTIAEFEQAFDVSTVVVDTYTTNEQVRQTLQREGLGAYDLVFPSDWMVTRLASNGMLRPLEREKLPNWENLDTHWVEQAPYDPGPERYSAPYQWGTTGIAWNSNVIDAASGLDSWDAMWNPEWSGHITMLNNKRETIGAALKRLGYSLNTRSAAEIEEATETLVQQKDLLLEYNSADMPSNLADERASPVHTWSGEAFIASTQLDSANSAPPIHYTVPAEGGVVWIDTAAIPRDAPHPNTAHLFVDYLLNARVNAAITTTTKYATPNDAAKEYIDDSLLENDLIFPPADTLDNLEFIRDVGDASEHYVQAWKELKSA